ncbi:MAG: apolipoprotein N-acyltransferase [Kiritimatiellae bacterium]|nr:apolipoprotein N-acyltransferase [Kiritimatiellia bacterium]
MKFLYINMLQFQRIIPWIGALCSGLLLAASFPPLEWKDAAWISFVPLILGLRGADYRQAVRLGFISGTVFWLFSIHWLTHVTYIGWMALSLYCAIYFVPFSIFVSRWIHGLGTKRWVRNLGLMLSAPIVWVGFEYVRSVLFTGFAWNTLGVSQYTNIPIIQWAAWGGVYAVSAVIMLINMAIGLTIFRYLNLDGRWQRQMHPELMMGFLILACVFLLGWRSIQNDHRDTEPVRIGLVQPNIPQSDKWTEAYTDEIYDRLKTLTDILIGIGSLDIIVWPETAVPDYIRSSKTSYDLVYNLVTNGTPILVGSMDLQWQDDEPLAYYNSSFLFGSDGTILQHYDKQHLVMFGEYTPLNRWLPFIDAFTPIDGNFTAGTTGTVFKLPPQNLLFSALICFEDTIASAARHMVIAGARFLINQTNDAWFDVSSGSKQHMAHCVFRCVENRVPAVRCANTGITCAIDRSGRIYDVFEGPNGNTLASGFKITQLAVPMKTMSLTFYTQYGDWVGFFAALASCLLLSFVVRITSQKSKDRPESVSYRFGRRFGAQKLKTFSLRCSLLGGLGPASITLMNFLSVQVRFTLI